jgi:hypothetical protein
MRQNASSRNGEELGRRLGHTLSLTARRLRRLARAGVVHVVGAAPIRSALKRLCALMPEDEMAPAPFVDSIARLVDVCGSAMRPIPADGIPRAAVLDSDAREQLGALLAALRPKVERIVDQSSDRANAR